MENINLVEKLRSKTNISYEEAKTALELCNWDILDAIVYLERLGRIDRPSTSEYFTNEYKKNDYTENSVPIDNIPKEKQHYKRRHKKSSSFEGFFEAVCNTIDICNNIFFQIKREDRIVIRLPLTVMILLLTFSMWITIPLAIVALFFDIEFSLSGRNVESSKINEFFNYLSSGAKKIKNNFKKGSKYD